MEGEEERPEGGDLKLEVEEVSFGLFLSSGFWHQVSGIRFLASGFWHQVSGIRFLASGFWPQVSSLRFQFF